MRMRENIMEVYKVLSSDEVLLRLLYYVPSGLGDNPLAPDKPNILDKPIEERWQIIQDVIKSGIKQKELDDVPKCRLLIYPGDRRGIRNNYLLSNQDIVIDVIAHVDFDNVDFRCSWICDRVNELLNNNSIVGLSKMYFIDGGQITNLPREYVGYRLVYRFISPNEMR